MDKTLKLKLREFQKAINSLKKALQAPQNDLIRDSTIKRFEYTFELLWKTTKIYLAATFGVDIFSPKECFRELRRNQKISDIDTEGLLKMADDRNEIIHTYNEKFADELYLIIKKDHYLLIEMVYKILSQM